jgi:flagellar hook-associated protein 1 FlgK
MNTVGHNITNADTDGYSRQLVSVGTKYSQTIYTSNGVSQLGNGADVKSIVRARDSFSDRQYWKENTTLSYYEAMTRSYDKLEAILDDSGDTGIQNSMNLFIKSLENLDSNASTDSVRTVVRDQAKDLCSMISSSSDNIRSLINENVSDIKLYVDQVNNLTTEIAELNRQIVMSEGSGSTANDLRDSRDLLVDELSTLINVSVTERENGAYTITSSGNTLVYNHSTTQLYCVSSPDSMYGTDSVAIKLEGTDFVYQPTDGKLKGYQDGIGECQNYLDKLGQMSAYLLGEFNYIHNSGFGIDDCATGYSSYTVNNDGTIDLGDLNYSNNFFGEDSYKYEYNPITRMMTKTKYESDGSIALDANGDPITEELTVAQAIGELSVNTKFYDDGGTNAIAAKQLPQTTLNGTKIGEDNAAGTNAALLATAINSDRTNASDGNQNIFGGTSMSEFYISLITELGSNSSINDKLQTNQEGIVEEVTAWRSDTSGVNWDEELTNMIMYQQGYKACSRCITAIEEMLDALIAAV